MVGFSFCDRKLETNKRVMSNSRYIHGQSADISVQLFYVFPVIICFFLSFADENLRLPLISDEPSSLLRGPSSFVRTGSILARPAPPITPFRKGMKITHGSTNSICSW